MILILCGSELVYVSAKLCSRLLSTSRPRSSIVPQGFSSRYPGDYFYHWGLLSRDWPLSMNSSAKQLNSLDHSTTIEERCGNNVDVMLNLSQKQSLGLGGV